MFDIDGLLLDSARPARDAWMQMADGQPAPDVCRPAVERLRADAATTLAFEDSGPGALAAITAGLGAAVLDSLDAVAAHSRSWFGIDLGQAGDERSP